MKVTSPRRSPSLAGHGQRSARAALCACIRARRGSGFPVWLAAGLLAWQCMIAAQAAPNPEPAGALPSLHEDFEAYLGTRETSKPVTGRGMWRESAYGAPGGSVVTRTDDSANPSVVLRAPGGRDHWNRLVPDRDLLARIVSSPSFALGVRTRPVGISIIHLGLAPKYNPRMALSLRISDRLQLTVGSLARNGVLRLAKDRWYDVRAVVEWTSPDRESGSVTVALRGLGDPGTEWAIDPGLARLKVDFDHLPPKSWDGLLVRLDRTGFIDDLQLQAVPTSAPFPGGATVADLDIAFTPLLGHVLRPRRTLDLGGLWDCAPEAPDAAAPPAAAAAWQPVLVPDQHAFPERGKRRLWFRRVFEAPREWNAVRVDLCFERVTDTAEVYLNGHRAGSDGNGHFPFRIDVTDAIRSGDENVLLVAVAHPGKTEANGNKPVGWSWFYPTYAGIPFPVHLETHGPVHITDVFVQPRLEPTSEMETAVTIRNDSGVDVGVNVTAVVQDAFEHTMARAFAPAGESVTVPLLDPWETPVLWWPHQPHLYSLDCSLVVEGRTVDAYRQRFGFREFRVEGRDVTLNGRRFMHRRNSVIPYWQRNTDAFLRPYYAQLREQGFVGTRIHGGAFQRFCRVADEMGWLLTPESAVNEPRGHAVTDAFWPAAEDHLCRMVKLLRNHPSVAYWSVSNEFGSNYMPADHPDGPAADAWLERMGAMVRQLDPTRTVTFSGDLDLGGRGKHGPAPTLSYHYAWQPFKLRNMIPTTSYWLDEGLVPWQGIVWEKRKPLILSEDLHPPYAFKPPHGMTQWAGDAAYDHDHGYLRAWFDAIRMLAEGYYHAQVAGWNPWATGAAGRQENTIYQFGKPMPDFLIATREQNHTFFSDETVSRTLYVYNQLFEDLGCRLDRDLVGPDGRLNQESESFPLAAGATRTTVVRLRMPGADTRQDLRWHLRLSSGIRILTERVYEFAVFPTSRRLRLPQGSALVAGPGLALDHSGRALDAPLGVHSTVAAAIGRQPAVLVLAGVSLSRDDGDRLEAQVKEGLRVLLLETPPGSWLPTPLQVDSQHVAAHAFVRSPNDPVLRNWPPADLTLWRGDGLVSRWSLIKPDDGDFDVIADCGGPDGLAHTPLMRLRRGRGAYLFCQLPVWSRLGLEPVADALLGRLLSDIAAPRVRKTSPLFLAALTDSQLRQALIDLHVPFREAGPGTDQRRVLLVDGSQGPGPALAAMIAADLAAGSTVILQRPRDELLREIEPVLGHDVALQPSDVAHVLRRTTHPLLDGISNDDLFWKTPSGTHSILSARITGVAAGHGALTDPAGIVAVRVPTGTLILCTIRWDQALQALPQRAARLARTLLGNAGADMGRGFLDPRSWVFLDLSAAVNRGFHDQPGTPGPRGWFGGGLDDMRYFPVNRTGIDPRNNVPAPLEPFPATVTLAGVSFSVSNPDEHHGRCCLVLENAAGEASVPLGAEADRLWFLGALRDMVAVGTDVLAVDFCFVDGTRERRICQAGVHVDGFAYRREPLTRGRLAWTGDNGRRKGVALYAWAVTNPSTEKRIGHITLSAEGKPIAIIAITAERAALR